MGQRLLTYSVSSPAVFADLEGALTEAGFAVYKALRNGLAIRVREETDDERAATAIVKRLAPDSQQIPTGTPPVEIANYRHGL